MNTKVLKLTLAGMAGWSAVAQAAPNSVIYTPQIDSSTNVLLGPNTGHSVRNGTILPSTTQLGSNGGNSASGSAIAQESHSFAQGGSGLDFYRVDSLSAVNLAAGTLKASSLDSSTGNNLGRYAITESFLQDTLFFNNTSGAPVVATLRFAFDGVINRGAGGGLGGNLGFDLYCTNAGCANETGNALIFANGPTRIADNAMYYFFNANNNAFNDCFGENGFCGQASAPYFETWLANPLTAQGGIVDGYIQTSLLVPTGNSNVGLRARLQLDCRFGANCDFGSTGSFSFGDLPEGLSYTSASGAFLTQTAGGVPEPASWAMLIAGFGLAGAAMRRRRIRSVAC